MSLVDATLRASAPYQRARRKRADGTKNEARGVHIEQSIAMAKKRLEQMPCGGGSPLAHALHVSFTISLFFIYLIHILLTVLLPLFA